MEYVKWYKKSKKVHAIMCRIAELSNNTPEEIFKIIGWPLYNTYDHALDGLYYANRSTMGRAGTHRFRHL